MIRRILLVAGREFTTTVSSKGFLVGVFLMPLLAMMVVVAIPRMLNGRNAGTSGQIEVMDPTGVVTTELRRALDPAAVAARKVRNAGAQAGRGPDAAIAAGSAPKLTLVEKPPDESLAVEKQWLVQRGKPDLHHLALVVLHPDAVASLPARSGRPAYDLYVSADADGTTRSIIQEAMRDAIVAARFKNRGIDRDSVEASMQVAQPVAVIVTRGAERSGRTGPVFLLPFLCGVLLFAGVITGGQVLLTSTVEEKSSRVVEVLLAAVSPIELMSGKLIGQLGVSLVTMTIYLGLGVLALIQYSMSGMLEPGLVAYFMLFYLLAYLVYGGLMLAIGAAVNQVADAQSLMGPIMLLMLAPYILVPIISQAPNSPLSIVMSFIPPMNSFAILARLASGTPPPLWQVLGSAVAGVLGAALAVWFAAKVFRIGLLMHGKPPNFVTLIRWARMA